MDLYPSAIQGLKELSSIGRAIYYYNHDMQTSYNSSMATIGHDCSVVMASVTVDQRDAIKLLKDNDFAQVGRARRNPNSGNSILLFVKFVGKQKRKRKK